MRIGSAFIISTLLYVSCTQSPAKTHATIENITESVYASGIVTTLNQYQVFASASGIISKIYVSENDLVHPGTPLFKVTDKAISFSRENAQLSAQYQAMAANTPKLTEAQNAITLANSRYQNDSILFKRQQNLWNQGIGSRNDLEQRELSSFNSKNLLQSAIIRYNDLRRQLKFNDAESKNMLAINEYRQGELTIKSEISGKVYSLFKVQGEMVNPQIPIAIIGDASSFLLQLQIDEYDIAKIKTGQQVLVLMDSYKGKVFEATITKIYPIMNERTRSFEAEAVFVSMPPTLFPNLTIEANIILKEKKNALTIPRNYLLNDSMVLVEKDKPRKVITGLMDYQKAEILSGLNATELIYKPR